MKKLVKVAVLSLAAIGAGLVGLASAESAPTKGRIPSLAFRPDGTIERKDVPDYVVSYSRDGRIAGYVRKDDILPPPGEPHRVFDIPVLDDSLKNLVGHMVPGRGFVPVGHHEPDPQY